MTVEREQREEPREESAELMLPAQLDSVTIVGPGGERAEAQIAERDRRSLVVAPLRAAKAELGGAPTDDLVLEFSPVPEPSTWALLAGGSAAVGFVLLRRRRFGIIRG